MDWTPNPLVALYFAVSAPFNGDSAVYLYDHSGPFMRARFEKDVHPLEIQELYVYLPSHINPRIQNQSGVFTAHPDPTIVLDEPSLREIIIPEDSRYDMKKDLFLYDVNPKTIFPDLGGLADWVTAIKYEGVLFDKSRYKLNFRYNNAL
jgi:hypothetical protein